MTQQQDPILAALSRIEKQNDHVIESQNELSQRIDAIHRDCRRTSLIAGGAAGALTGPMVTTAIEFLRIKFGG